ncbi:MAG: hypothetical protein LBU20_00390 [Candidatus Nomurabacteria bacterium]|nr:hypothetical protein [Candidatus Nomurabacteria bacterium]
MIVKLEKLVVGGQALGTLADGRKVFVWGGLPQETVEVVISKSKKSYAEGLVERVLTASGRRAAPKDDCYLSTSPWQIMDYQFELAQKTELVQEAFRQQGITLPKSQLATDGQDFFYRNKMEYALWWSNQKSQIELAFHRRGSHQKVPVASSSIERPEIFAEAVRMVERLNAQQAEARTYQSLMLRCDQAGQVSGGLFENYQPHPQMPRLTDTILGREYSYLPNGFFQINLPVYELAVAEIRRQISTDLPIVDMYAGVGTIGLSAARENQPVSLIETNKAAFSELQNNCLGQKSAKAVFSDAENALDYIIYDINLIVDPPRAGLDEAVVARILKSTPKKLIYLSCNPITQARDIAKLTEKYQISQNFGYNFFPRTPHIENLVVLERL